MKLHKRLLINGDEFLPINDNSVLDLFTPGRAVYTVKSAVKLSGSVVLDFGYSLDKMKTFFVGYIETSTSVDSNQQRIFCREISAKLNTVLPLNLRAPTYPDVLKSLSKQTGLFFSFADNEHSNKKTPVFYSCNTGYHSLDSIGKVFEIPKYIWQQQGDGKIFSGSWNDSYFSNKPLTIPPNYQQKVGISGRASIAAFPGLRPGAMINGEYLTGVTLIDHSMNLTWNKDPWKK